MLPLHIFSLVLVGIALLLGISTNAFTVAVITNQCRGCRRLPPSCNLLLLALALVNIPMQCCATGDYLVRVPGIQVISRHHVSKALFVLFPFLAFCSFWMNAWLCVFYCAKIVNLPQPWFTRLKLGISGMVPWLLLVSLLIGFGISVPGIWTFSSPSAVNCTTSNATLECNVPALGLLHNVLMAIVGCFVPLALILISALLVLTSLYTHTQRMRQNTSGSQGGPSMGAHTGAATTILSLLALYGCEATAMILGIMESSELVESAIQYICMYVNVSYPCVNSMILILGNSNLKTVAMNLFCHHQH